MSIKPQRYVKTHCAKILLIVLAAMVSMAVDAEGQISPQPSKSIPNQQLPRITVPQYRIPAPTLPPSAPNGTPSIGATRTYTAPAPALNSGIPSVSSIGVAGKYTAPTAPLNPGAPNIGQTFQQSNPPSLGSQYIQSPQYYSTTQPMPGGLEGLDGNPGPPMHSGPPMHQFNSSRLYIPSQLPSPVNSHQSPASAPLEPMVAANGLRGTAQGNSPGQAPGSPAPPGYQSAHSRQFTCRTVNYICSVPRPGYCECENERRIHERGATID